MGAALDFQRIEVGFSTRVVLCEVALPDGTFLATANEAQMDAFLAGIENGEVTALQTLWVESRDGMAHPVPDAQIQNLERVLLDRLTHLMPEGSPA